MGTTIEYNSKLAVGDKITFYLDGEKLVGEVLSNEGEYWISFCNEGQNHKESVNKIFSHFGISDKSNFRNKIIGRNWEGGSGIWPYTDSLENLKKMLDAL